MKLKQQVMLAVAAALSVNAAFAAGVTPTQINTARSAGTLDQVWLAGASAPTKSIYEGWVKGCTAGTSSVFTNQSASDLNRTPGSLGNFVAYGCVRNGRTSVLYHTVDGGSLNAFTPFTNGTKLSRVKYIFNAGCALQATGYVDASAGGSVNNADMYKGCSVTGTAVVLDANDVQNSGTKTQNTTGLTNDPNGPQQILGGFSDVEPTLFSPSIGGGDVSNFGTVSEAYLGQAFGVAVSVPLYRKLQQVQGITATDTSFDPALAPSLSKVQIASILAEGGTVQASKNWNAILGGSNTQKVIIQRRVATSGTQASSNAFFLGNPCTGTSGLNPASSTLGNYQVIKNSSTGNVKSGITTATNNPDASLTYAIGVLSMENDWRVESAANAGYRYIKIDGNHPEQGDTANARLAAAAATYPLHMEMKAFTAYNVPAFAGNLGTVVDDIVAALKEPSDDACAIQPRGLTLNPDTANNCAVGVVKAKATNFGNNCAPATLF